MKSLFRGLNRNVFALGATSFFTDFASEMVFPLMPTLLKEIAGDEKKAKAALGLVEGTADSLAALLRIVSGWLSDRVGKRKPLVFWGYALSAAVRPLYWAATAVGHVLAIRVADRIGKGTRLAARDALIADSCQPEVRGAAFGLQNGMDNLGAAIGPLVATALIVGGLSLRGVFLWTAVPGALVLLTIAFFVRDVPRKDGPPAKLNLSLAPFTGRFRWFVATVFVFTLANSTDAFLVMRMTEVGIPLKWVPIVWAGFSALRALVALPGGALSDRFPRPWVVLAGWLIYAATYAGFAFTSTVLPFLGLLAAYSTFSALATSNLRAIVSDQVPAHLRGTAFGIFYFAIGIAALPASVAFGAVNARWGAPAAFLMDAAIALVACLMLLGVPRAVPAKV
ncbi:MAG: major facilitator family [Planctomycetota bacterium]|nr:MAG: major facilitator family [Planctomycetota bacterium]